ncbi:MAG: ABC transporter substrate-binding protein, partial [Defluviitaleaceae bacterium]|nr:ABC transporter substrate-binding protein [Defluviitaleaceae bacterium]
PPPPPPPPTPEEPGEPVAFSPDNHPPATLRVAWWGGDARHAVINAGLDLFEERYPHITIVREYGAFGPYLDALIVMLADGNEPDVLQSNYAWIHFLAGGNNPFLNLFDFADIIDLGEWTPELLAYGVTADGQKAGVIHGLMGRVLAYDTRVYPDGFPATFDEWIAMAPDIVAGNTALDTPGNQYAFWPLGSPGNNLSMDILIMNMIHNHYGGMLLESNGRINPTVDQVEYIFNIIQRMIDVGLLPTHEQMEDAGDATTPVWMEGRGGAIFEWASNIHLAGSAFLDNSIADRNMGYLNVSLIPAITPGGSRDSIARPSLVHAVGANTNYPELSVYLLNWIYTDSEALDYFARPEAFGVPLSNSANQRHREMGGVWGIQEQAFIMLEDNLGQMDGAFENVALRAERVSTIEMFRNGELNAREAAERWVNNQQYQLGN